MTGESGGSGLTQKAIHPNVFRLNPDRLCEIAACDRVKITGLPSGQVGKRFTMASVKRIRFLNFSQVFGSGIYPEGPENTSTDSIIFKCALDVASQSKDRTAETEACPAALYQRPS